MLHLMLVKSVELIEELTDIIEDINEGDRIFRRPRLLSGAEEEDSEEEEEDEAELTYESFDDARTELFEHEYHDSFEKL